MKMDFPGLGLAVLCAIHPGLAAAQAAAFSAKDLGRLFDGSAPSASAAAPVQTHQSDARGRIEAVLGDEYAIIGLNPAALASATPEEKIAMLQTLIAASGRNTGGGDGGGDPNAGGREQAVYRILGSAKDAADFDRVYYRVEPRGLWQAADQRRIKAMVAAQRATAVPGDWEGFGRYIDTVAGTESSGKNRVQFLIDGDGAIAPITAAIESAARSVHLEVFQFQPDAFGQGVADLLSAKAAAGVKVRLMVDQYGTEPDPDIAAKVEAIFDGMRKAGVQIIIPKGTLLNTHLDHRKVLVVDGEVAFTGGMNVGQSYQKDWHDQQTMIIGPAVTKLQEAFVGQWRAAGGTFDAGENLYPPQAEVAGGSETRVVSHAGGKDRNIKAGYLRAFLTAEREVRIANPYFVDSDVVAVLCGLAKRGVKVQVVVPEDNDVAIVQRGSRAFYPDLLAAGVEIYEYQGRMAHQKVAVIDGFGVTAGSSNMDSRSFVNNDELNIIMADRELAAYVNKHLFDEDLKHSTRITSYSPTLRERLDRVLLEEQL
ncbi:MAG: phospholipase D-like domain-containing protein [Elusimicrobia bacterium]|nr:phospholipase D-like domain-containing protein [Elusimicrobiota bacterium]